jgi:hypothetical protein
MPCADFGFVPAALVWEKTGQDQFRRCCTRESALDVPECGALPGERQGDPLRGTWPDSGLQIELLRMTIHPVTPVTSDASQTAHLVASHMAANPLTLRRNT